MEDRRIIELFYERSEQAVFELSEKYGKLCLKIALNIVGDPRDAEECVNEAYLGVWKSIPPERPEHLRAYLCAIVRNIALKRYKANTALESSVLSETINSFLDSLDPVNRSIFMRRYWFFDPISEIAEAFGITEHNVSVRLSRTRSKMRRFLKKEGIWL